MFDPSKALNKMLGTRKIARCTGKNNEWKPLEFDYYTENGRQRSTGLHNSLGFGKAGKWFLYDARTWHIQFDRYPIGGIPEAATMSMDKDGIIDTTFEILDNKEQSSYKVVKRKRTKNFNEAKRLIESWTGRKITPGMISAYNGTGPELSES